jgi:hypothetical protein
MSEPQEEWRRIAAFPNYVISNQGRVRRDRSSPRHPVSGQHLRPRAGKKGHLYVNLGGTGAPKSCYVHRLVATAFIGPPPSPKHQVAHWDGDTSNNTVGNLRWATNKENSQDSIRLGRNRRPRGVAAARAKLTIEQVRLIRADHSITCREWGRRLNVSHNIVSAARRGLTY